MSMWRKQANRTCQQCGGAIPDRMARQRNDNGDLVCASCAAHKPWNTTHSSLSIPAQAEMRRREAAAIVSVSRVLRRAQAGDDRTVYDHSTGDGPYVVLYSQTANGAGPRTKSIFDADFDRKRALQKAKGDFSGEYGSIPTGLSFATERSDSKTSMRRMAHDGGDNATVNHCPFCGSGAVAGGSDGSVSCEFCHNTFTVQAQPADPFMPQTVDGAPINMPGMPQGGTGTAPGEEGQQVDLSNPHDPATDPDNDPTKDQGQPGAQPGAAPAKPPAAPGAPAAPGQPHPSAPAAPGQPGKPPSGPVPPGASQPASAGAPAAPGAKPNPFAKTDAPPKPGDPNAAKPADSSGDSSDDDDDPKKKNLPPWLKKKTSLGGLEVDDYLAKLALRHADDATARTAVLDRVRIQHMAKRMQD